jgi:hypothetical protein
MHAHRAIRGRIGKVILSTEAAALEVRCPFLSIKITIVLKVLAPLVPIKSDSSAAMI